MIKPFKRLRGGIDPLRAEDWNRLTKIVEGLANMTAASPLMITQTAGGTALSLAKPDAGQGAVTKIFFARVTNAGPSAEADYADERYWVRENYLTNTGEADTTALTFGDSATDERLWVTASNLAEVIAGTHLFPVASNYRVIVYQLQDLTPVSRYVFTSLPIVVN